MNQKQISSARFHLSERLHQNSLFENDSFLIQELRRIYQLSATCLVNDHPNDPMDINDETSYDLGKLHGIQLALTTAEKINRIYPAEIAIH